MTPPEPGLDIDIFLLSENSEDHLDEEQKRRSLANLVSRSNSVLQMTRHRMSKLGIRLEDVPSGSCHIV